MKYFINHDSVLVFRLMQLWDRVVARYCIYFVFTNQFIYFNSLLIDRSRVLLHFYNHYKHEKILLTIYEIVTTQDISTPFLHSPFNKGNYPSFISRVCLILNDTYEFKIHTRNRRNTLSIIVGVLLIFLIREPNVI